MKAKNSYGSLECSEVILTHYDILDAVIDFIKKKNFYPGDNFCIVEHHYVEDGWNSEYRVIFKREELIEGETKCV